MARFLETTKSGPARWAVLLVLATASALTYFIGLTRPLWLPTYYRMPHMDTPKILGVSDGALIHFAVTFLALLAMLIGAYCVSSGLQSRVSAAGVLALGSVLSASLLMMYPGGAGDVFGYIGWADIVLRYHENPFVVPPLAHPEYALLPFLDFPNETMQYGPLWLAVSVLLRAVASNDILASLLLFKAASAIFLLATAWLVYLVLERIDPRFAVPGLILVAWNPLLIWESAGNAHNDVMMALFMAATFYFHVRRWPRLAVTSLLAAVLVKYVAAVLLPLLLIAMLRKDGPMRSWLPHAAAYGAAALCLALPILCMATLQGTIGTIFNRTEMFTTSPAAVAQLYLSQSLDPTAAGRLASRASQAIFGVLIALEAWRVWRHPGTLSGSALRVVLALMLLVITWFQPWYSVWAIPLAAIVGTRLSTGIILGLTAGSLSVYAVMGFGWRLNWHHDSQIVIQAAGVCAQWLPVVAAATLPRLGSAPTRRRPATVPAASGATNTPASPPPRQEEPSERRREAA